MISFKVSEVSCIKYSTWYAIWFVVTLYNLDWGTTWSWPARQAEKPVKVAKLMTASILIFWLIGQFCWLQLKQIILRFGHCEGTTYQWIERILTWMRNESHSMMLFPWHKLGWGIVHNVTARTSFYLLNIVHDFRLQVLKEIQASQRSIINKRAQHTNSTASQVPHDLWSR